MQSFNKNLVSMSYISLDKYSMACFLLYMSESIYIHKYFLEGSSTFYLFTANFCCICPFQKQLAAVPKSILIVKIQINILLY